MPHNLYKDAGLRVPSNFDDLVDVLRSTGSKFADGNARQVAKNITYGKAGTGSMFLDLGKGLIKKGLPFKSKTGETVGTKVVNSINKKYDRLQRGLVNADIKAGSKIYQKLDSVKLNTKYSGGDTKTISQKIKKVPENLYNGVQRAKFDAAKKARDAFVYKHDVPLAKKINGVANQSMEVNVPGITAPIEKTKKAVLPIVGAFAASSQISKLQDNLDEKEKLRKGGDTVKSKTALSREELIEKVASMLGSDNSEANQKLVQIVQDDRVSKLASIAIKASEALKSAAVQLKEKDEMLEKLASENRSLHLEITTKNRLERATKLAYEMNEKGMIKKADVSQKIEDIITLEDDAYIILKQAVENTVLPEGKNGIDSLTFLDGNYNINIEGKSTSLMDAINNEF